jgi:thiamine transport system substrate-binding protein
MKSRLMLCALLFMAALALAACPAPATVQPTAAPTAGPTQPAEPTDAPVATEAPPATAPATGATLTVMTHDSFSVSEQVVAAFQSQCGCQVQFLKSGDTGAALNKAILSKGNPLADVFFGVDNTFLSRALAADIFEPYASPALAGIPDALKLDPSNRLLPVDFGYVTINYDREYFADNDIPLPASLRDLTNEAYKGMLVVQNPASSSPGLAFLAATVAEFGESGDYTYLDFWRDLRANDVLVTEGWEDAYYGQFSGGSGEGDRPMVVSYATSPAAEVFFADPQPADSPTGSLDIPGGAFEQVEFVGILQGAKQPALARQWIDFMLGDTFQPDIPLQMWVYPARPGTALPEVFTKFAQEPSEVATLTPEQLQAGREGWIQAWTDVVLR